MMKDRCGSFNKSNSYIRTQPGCGLVYSLKLHLPPVMNDTMFQAFHFLEDCAAILCIHNAWCMREYLIMAHITRCDKYLLPSPSLKSHVLFDTAYAY